MITNLRNFILQKRKYRKYLLGLMPKNSCCAEIGVWKGEFGRQILKTVKPKKLYLIDPWEYMPKYVNRLYGGRNNDQKKMDKIYQKVLVEFGKHPEVKIYRNYSDKIADKFKDKYFDWIYIDANHSYDYVFNDLMSYYPKVKKGGYITGDDYLPLEWVKGYGVKKAVDTFLKKKKLKLISSKGGQFILKKI